MPPQYAPERLSPPGDDTLEQLRPPERNTSERHPPLRQEAPERIGPPGTERLSQPGAERLSPPVPILPERSESPDVSAFGDFLNLDPNPNDGYELIEASIVSGASVTIMPKEMCGHLPIHPTRDSVAGVVYEAASGHPDPDWGSRTFSAQIDEFRDRWLTIKVGPVRKLLMAVSDMTPRGNRVAFEPQGSYVEHVASGERTVIEKKNGIYVCDEPMGQEGVSSSEPHTAGTAAADPATDPPLDSPATE